MDHAEGQGWKIGAVVFFVFAVIFGVLAYVFYDKYDQSRQNTEQARKSESDAKRSRDQTRQEYDEMRRVTLGADPETDHKNTMGRIDLELKQPKLGADRLAQTGQHPSVLAALTYYQTELGKSDQLTKDQKDNLQKTQKELSLVRGQYDLEKEKAYEAQSAKERELADESNRLHDELKKAQAGVLDTYQRYRQKSDELEQEKANSANTIGRLERELKSQQFMVESLRERENRLAGQKFERSDGEVVAITPKGDEAYVNIGQKDGVKTPLSFGIYGQDVGGNPNILPKATLEITGILDEHRSIGRIRHFGELPQAERQAVIPGDQIYNPIWDRGSRERIAFVGLIYMDDDDEWDNDAFKRLVEEMGGRIDAEMNMKTGQVVGQIDHNTRWLVIGEIPDVKEHEKDQQMVALIERLTQAMSTMIGQARSAGVRTVNLPNFLTSMGHDAPWRTVPAGDEYKYLRRQIRGRPRMVDKAPGEPSANSR